MTKEAAIRIIEIDATSKELRDLLKLYEGWFVYRNIVKHLNERIDTLKKEKNSYGNRSTGSEADSAVFVDRNSKIAGSGQIYNPPMD